MRKMLRMKMRKNAEQQDGKTIKLFRKFWKDRLKSSGAIDLSKRRKKLTKKYLW